jgi:hypothetical protein
MATRLTPPSITCTLGVTARFKWSANCHSTLANGRITIAWLDRFASLWPRDCARQGPGLYDPSRLPKDMTRSSA